MILPQILLLFQILLGGSMYATHTLVKMSAQSSSLRTLYNTIMRITSLISLQRVATTFELEDSYVDKIKLIKNNNPLIRGRQIMFTQELTIPPSTFKEEIDVQSRVVPVRKHRLDKFQLYYPGYF
ncbi:hypothetical protein AKO1_009923 [Acrasis kona]|uniref:Uncharacterized protein n=1 Tax=Acrasis kona TaxID=1008807 RepID=A0AAW2ZPC0_9EUKA